MKKIVIADDDFLVRTYLKQMLPWEEMGFVVAGDARNGKEALTLVQQEQPTLLITDICMPVMNGIDLIKALKAAGSPVHILVLSCHDDFAYVKEAMQLGIDDYILKTDLTPEKMEEFLSRCVQASEGEVSETLGTDDLVRIGRGKLRQDFFAAFSRGVGEDELRALARAGGIDPEIQLAGAMLIHIQDWGRRRQELSSDGFASFCRAFHDLCRDLCGRDGTVLRMELFQPVEEAADWGLLADYTLRGGSAHADRALQEMAAKLRHMMERYLGVETIIVTAASVRSLVALQDVWRRLYAEREALFYEEAGCISAQTLVPTGAVGAVHEAALTRLVRAVQEGSAEEIRAEEEAFFTLLQAQRIAPQELERLLRERLAGWEGGAFEMSVQLRAVLGAWLTKKGAEHRLPHPAIRSALRYMEEHCHEELSQTEVADHVHLNAAYFSTLFKKTTGVSFSEHLARLRIGRVQQRLRAEDGRIKDIAEAEGFADYQYFCKLFKRIVGISPGSYRQRPNA